MRETVRLFRRERRARLFFAALTQSSIGTGAGYVALLLIAYERFESPWAISLVLIAELVPAMALGPLFGAAADRWSRRSCLILADLVRAAAFAGIAFASSFELTLVLAVVAGAGTGLFTPAALAALPGLVAHERLPAATSVYGAIADLGFTVGPAVAAGFLLVGGPETILFVNAASFAVSALVLARMRFGERSPAPSGVRSLVRDTRDGLRATAGMPGIRVVIAASSAALFFAGLFNVGELLFATEELDASDVGFSALVGMFGLGFVVGSLGGSQGGEPPRLKREYLTGLLLMAVALVAAGVAPSLGVALVAFAVAGFGNGAVLVYERLLIQTTVADALLGRVFGIKDALSAWAFAASFLLAGLVLSLTSVRTMMVLAGAGGLVVWAFAARALRATWSATAVEPAARTPLRAGPRRDGGAGEHGADLVDGRERWLALLDDLR